MMQDVIVESYNNYRTKICNMHIPGNDAHFRCSTARRQENDPNRRKINRRYRDCICIYVIFDL